MTRPYPGWTLMTPAQAASGSVDLVPISRWPMLAAHWLAAGFDSPQLREYAGLAEADVTEARELMPAVLESIGLHVVTVDELAERCRVALAVVQRDLDATGFGEYVMRPVNLAGGPLSLSMYAALPDGRSWSGGCGGATPDMTDTILLWYAAHSVSDTLGEVLKIHWPVCLAHGGGPMTPPDHTEMPHGEIDGVVWWWCRPAGRPGHAAAPVGQLSNGTAAVRG